MDEVNQRLQLEAQRIASRHPIPEFYVRFRTPLAIARKLYFSDPMVRLLREVLEPVFTDDFGHGLFHSSRVGIDSAALLFIELETTPMEQSRVTRLMVLGLLAGLLHDIRRNEENHAEAGAEEAERVLRDMPLDEDEVRCICLAIKNHEAFTETVQSRRPWFQLVSDCLYDADKFRWGPDTFTHTLWHMAHYNHLTPQELIGKFPWGIEGLFRIQKTFRTSIGRDFGPQIIDTGLEIGKEIYRYLLKHFGEDASG
ncbi:hypothetical protein [Desulforhabdus amnigena]|jgi:hypothetical protein|uniref:HD domain-containing protein n=1 Tax=Desulforhabdus amnigena TaxID=40218 RepID=A0A9W6FWU2_9BACT|nr:hypothetical protein [Desulforhabdus amnigena]NLJ28537.1 hypothetical protein [Deltaproteobacteria bacterium]GLI36288.1 hypothetical protein DAMNIGENAA_37210 [Desulforhabdus amnigena]